MALRLGGCWRLLRSTTARRGQRPRRSAVLVCRSSVKARTEPHQVSAIALALTPSAYCMTDGGSIASGHLRSIRVSITSVRPAPFLVYASLLTHPGESAMSRFVPLVCCLLCLPAAGALHAAPVNPLNRDPHSASPLTPPSARATSEFATTISVPVTQRAWPAPPAVIAAAISLRAVCAFDSALARSTASAHRAWE